MPSKKPQHPYHAPAPSHLSHLSLLLQSLLHLLGFFPLLLEANKWRQGALLCQPVFPATEVSIKVTRWVWCLGRVLDCVQSGMTGQSNPAPSQIPSGSMASPAGNPLTEQGGAQGGTGWGREGGEEAEVVEIGEFATVGEGGMEETGEEDGGHGGGWRSPLT